MQIPSLKKLKSLYTSGKHIELARWLPHFQSDKDRFVKFLLESNLLYMGKSLIELKPLTLGADPEFILNDKDGNVVLFSSEWTNSYFGISEAEVGADYGLLEFRPAPAEGTKSLVKNIKELHKIFSESYEELTISEKEAVEFDHKKARLLESMKSDSEISFGPTHSKDVGVWNSGGQEIIVDNENITTFSAYGKPNFPSYNEKLLTAGGHIHIGGTFVKLLSYEQLCLFVRKLDEKILPKCVEVESMAGKLRREIYGKPGEFRIKDYGIEYRSPSNAIFQKKNLSILNSLLKEVEAVAKTLALE